MAGRLLYKFRSMIVNVMKVAHRSYVKLLYKEYKRNSYKLLEDLRVMTSGNLSGSIVDEIPHF